MQIGGQKDALTYPSKRAQSHSALFDFHRIAYEEASHDPIFDVLIMHGQRDGQAMSAVPFLSSLLPCHVRALKNISDQRLMH